MIKTAEYIISSARVEQCPAGNLPEFAFIGRSNVGKSSLINMLTGKSHLAKTSATPGKTVLINHFLVNGQGAKGRGEKNTKAGNNPLAPCPLPLKMPGTSLTCPATATPSVANSRGTSCSA